MAARQRGGRRHGRAQGFYSQSRGYPGVPGVDAFFIGPYDLSCSLGLPGQFEHPDFLAAMAEIRRIGAASGVMAGLHVVEPDLEKLRASLAEGYRFIAYSVDIRILDIGARQGVNFLRGVSA